MSFILDALRKSEHERQRQAEPGIADIRAGTRGRTGFPVWALALGALLLLNVIVVAVVVFRSNSTPAAAPAAAEEHVATTTVAAAAPAVAPSAATPAPAPPSTQTSTPLAPVPQQQLPAAAPTQVPQAAPEAAPAEADPTLRPPPPAPVADLPDESYENLPTLGDVQSHGATLPELHLDLHVYANRPADRFVFLNTRKYREGGKTPEGTTVERITPDGVVLNHHGVRFLLPRQ
jgi:general secretion pathway protein B